MNTRVQVEHCVTEMVTGIDIVKEGIRAAAGEPLSITQDDVELRGHAIECRINAEDASKNFAPAPGKIGAYKEPTGPGVRVDSGVGAGGEVSPMYDPMVAKLIVWDVDREQATQRMLRALGEYEIEGLTTLIPFHDALLRDRAVGERRDLPRPRRGQGVAEDARSSRCPRADEDEAPRPSSTTTRSRSPAGASTSRSSARRSPAAAAAPRRAAAAGREAAARRAQGRRRRGGPRPARVAAPGQHVEGRRRGRARRSRRASSSASSRR